MVMVASSRAGREYEVYDVSGRHLGRVLEADGPVAVGPGAATVLLQRGPEARRPAG